MISGRERLLQGRKLFVRFRRVFSGARSELLIYTSVVVTIYLHTLYTIHTRHTSSPLACRILHIYSVVGWLLPTRRRTLRHARFLLRTEAFPLDCLKEKLIGHRLYIRANYKPLLEWLDRANFFEISRRSSASRYICNSNFLANNRATWQVGREANNYIKREKFLFI